MDATLDFLSENAQRRYPLDADCLVAPNPVDPAVSGWSDGVLLDARGFWRGAGGATFYLSGFYGSQTPHPGLSSPAPGNASLYFSRDPGGATLDFRVDVPDALLATDFPLTLRAVAPDPDYATLGGQPGPNPDYATAGVLLGALEVTIGADVRRLAPDYAARFGASAPLEPGCVIDLGGGNQVDRVQAIGQLSPTQLVGGDLVLTSGYNVDVRTRGAVVEVSARVGGGLLGTYAGTYAGVDPAPCGAVLRTLNGVGPDGRGRFFLNPGPGVTIQNYPDQHRIDVTLSVGALGAAVCAPPTSS